MVGSRRLVLLLLPTALACRGAGERAPAADSAAARADTLPAEEARALALDSLVSDAWVAGKKDAGCLARDSAGVLRRRTVYGPSPDSARFVVFVRARGDADSLIDRVEVMRTPRQGTRIALTLDGAPDSTQVVRFPTGPGQSGSKTLAHGGPLAARLRALGRRALGVRCGGKG